MDVLVFSGDKVECPECTSAKVTRLLSVPAPPQSASSSLPVSACGEGPPCGAHWCQRKPALAEELKAIHDFEEDLREALGMKSLYNESLGTVSTFYQYDRVKDRDRGVPKRAWE